jgi:hypothetical protein
MIEHLSQYGLVGTIIGMVILGIAAVIKTDWFSKLLEKLIDRFFSKKDAKKELSNKVNIKNIISESDILNHDIFNYVDFWIYSKVPTLQFSSEYRTIVFRKYLTVFLNKHKEDIKKYIFDKDFQTMDSAQLWTSLLSLINNIIFDYEKEMEVIGIPKIIIEKMKSKNNDSISLTIDLIEGVCNSNFYTSEQNLLKMYSILNIMLCVLENTIYSSAHICNSINGQLKGAKFNDSGRIIEEP